MAVAAASWVGVAFGVGSEMTRPASFLFGWTLMMAAMMLPSVAPLVLLYARQARPESLAAGYLAVWAVAGLVVYALNAWVDLMEVPSAAVAGVLIAAGAYQLTPLKAACLRRCRSPVSFLVERWGRRPFRLGAEHGLFCLGCCWALMAVLVLAGAMGFVWAAGIALVVLLEKVGPAWVVSTRLVAVALVALGVSVAIDPQLAMVLSGNSM